MHSNAKWYREKYTLPWVYDKNSCYFPLKRLLETPSYTKVAGGCNFITSLAVINNTKEHVVGGSITGIVEVVDVVELSRCSWQAHCREVATVECGRTGLVTTGKYDQAVKLWDWEGINGTTKQGSNIIPLREYKGHTSFVTTCAIQPITGVIASGSLDCTVQLHHPFTPQDTILCINLPNPCTSLCFLPNNGWSILVADGQTVSVYDIRQCKNTSTPVRVYGYPLASQHVKTTGGLLRSMKRIKTSGWDSYRYSYNTKSDRDSYYDESLQCYRVRQDYHSELSTVFYATASSDGHQLLTAATDNTIKLWDTHTGQVLTTYTGATLTTQDRPLFLGDGSGILVLQQDKNNMNILVGWSITPGNMSESQYVMPVGKHIKGNSGNSIFIKKVFQENTLCSVVSNSGAMVVGSKATDGLMFRTGW